MAYVRESLAIRLGVLFKTAISAVFLALAVAAILRPQPSDDDGEKLLEKMCSRCHTPDVVKTVALDREGWRRTVQDMVVRGAKGTDEEIDKVVDYLAGRYGEDPPTSNKINVNKATAGEMETGLHISAKEAESIVKFRADKGDFRNLEDLKKVPNLDPAKLEAIRDRLVF